MKLEEIFKEGKSIESNITSLKDKSVKVESWNKLVKEYDPTHHKIMRDQVTRKDKIRKDGLEKAARVTYGQQKMFTRRMAQEWNGQIIIIMWEITDDNGTIYSNSE